MLCHDADKILHFLCSSIRNTVPVLIAGVFFAFFNENLSKNDDLRDVVHAKFFAQLLLALTINSTDVNNAVHLFCQLYVLIFEVLALLELWIKKVQNPDLFPSIKLENGAEIKLLNVSVLKQIWNHFLRFLLLLTLLIKSPTSEVELSTTCAATKELTEDIVEVSPSKSLLELEASTLLLLSLTLFMLTDTLRSLLVINPSLFSVTEHVIRVGNFLELLLGAFGVFRVFVWVVFDCKFLESFFNVCFCSVFLQAHHLVIVDRLILFLLWLALLLLLLTSLALSYRPFAQ